MNLNTHNGIFTVESNATGDSRTFRIHTQGEDADFMPGRRLLSLLTGPDNNSDYTSFGYFHEGRVVLWKKHRESKFYLWAKRFIENPDSYEDKVSILFEGRCIRCNRKLTTPESIRDGIGPICRGK